VTNLLGEPPETFLPEDPGAADLAGGTPARDVVAAQPASVLGWARLAEEQLNDGSNVEGYASARTSYHRSLDLLRANGWKGHGPVPWAHEPNRGFLRALAMLADASERLGDHAEAHRCREFLRESSREGYDALIG